MNVTLPEKPKGYKRRIAKYVVVLIACIIAIGIAMYQFFADEKLEVILGLTKSDTEEIEELKMNFDNIFTNALVEDDNVAEIAKIEENEGVVYAYYKKQENILGSYDLDVSIPYININDTTTKKYNEEIQRIFGNLSEEIQQTKDRNIIYTVKYMANVENNILSIVIRSNFKEGSNPQRTIIKTYNYNLSSHKEVTLNDFMKIKGIDRSTLEAEIKSEITEAQSQAEELKSVGYNIFSRDVTNSMYKLENTTEFFIYNNYLYLIYPYGNQNNTTEMDIVIL